MKPLNTILFAMLCIGATAQSIMQLRTYPANPSTTDTVLLLADL